MMVRREAVRTESQKQWWSGPTGNEQRGPSQSLATQTTLLYRNLGGACQSVSVTAGFPMTPSFPPWALSISAEALLWLQSRGHSESSFSEQNWDIFLQIVFLLVHSELIID